MKQIVWLEISLLAILVGCIPRFQSDIPPQGMRPETEIDVTKLLSANNPDAPLIDEMKGNCPIGDIEIPGEGSRAVGFVGGLAIAPNPVYSSGASVPTFEPFDIGSEMFTAAAFTPTEPAAIIIVDDFNGNLNFERRGDIHTKLGLSGVYFLDQRGGSTPTLAGLMSGASETEVTALENAGQYSHGALVFNHTLALLSAEDRNPELSVIPVSVPDRRVPINIPIFTFTKPNVVVAALDTQDFNTGIIGERLQATIRTLAQRQIRRFAVNLSFGLVPCSVLADIEAGTAIQPDLTFEKYQAEVFDKNKDNPGVNAARLRKDLINVLTTPIDGDPLLRGAATDPRRLAGATDITYLAASGNYRLPYSLYPGYWPEFISVSAQNLADTSTPAVRDSDYSNTGEVLMPGGYYKLTAYEPNTGDWRTYDNISIAGTSFSAPVLSVFTALNFTGATPRCAREPPSVTSPLAFFKTDPPLASPTPDLNLALGDALSKYCP